MFKYQLYTNRSVLEIPDVWASYRIVLNKNHTVLKDVVDIYALITNKWQTNKQKRTKRWVEKLHGTPEGGFSSFYARISV